MEVVQFNIGNSGQEGAVAKRWSFQGLREGGSVSSEVTGAYTGVRIESGAI